MNVSIPLLLNYILHYKFIHLKVITRRRTSLDRKYFTVYLPLVVRRQLNANETRVNNTQDTVRIRASSFKQLDSQTLTTTTTGQEANL